MNKYAELYPNAHEFLRKYIGVINRPVPHWREFFEKAESELASRDLHGLGEIFDSVGITEYPREILNLCKLRKLATETLDML